MTPADLMKAILQAPVDLLWNGGIGTYVKASTETHADVGDKANDAIRVDGADLRCKVVGEGGNLGLTQLGRIEFAQHGGKINTDAIDNSAGVDTSDHEVNIKILLNGVVADGDMTVKQRNKLLAEMTDEVGRAGPAQQLRAEPGDRQRAGPVQGHAPRPAAASCATWCARATSTGPLEFLPTDRQIRDAQVPGTGPDQPGDGRPAGVHEDHGRRRAAAHLAAGRPVSARPAARVLPDRAARAVRRGSTTTRCAARSPRPSWSTTRSTRVVRPICTGCARRPARCPRTSRWWLTSTGSRCSTSSTSPPTRARSP